MSLEVEGIVDGGMGGEKSLRRPRILETNPTSFSASNGLMRILRSVVRATTGHMQMPKPEIFQGGAVRTQFVGRDRCRNNTLPLEKSTHKLHCRSFVASWLHEDIEHFALCVDGAPQIHTAPADRYEHLIQVPSVIRTRSFGSQALRVCSPKSNDPTSDSLVTDVEPTLRQQVLDITEAEIEPEIQPNGMLDDGRRKLEAGVRDRFHRMIIMSKLTDRCSCDSAVFSQLQRTIRAVQVQHRFFAATYHMEMRRAMIVRVDDNPKPFDARDSYHSSI